MKGVAPIRNLGRSPNLASKWQAKWQEKGDMDQKMSQGGPPSPIPSVPFEGAFRGQEMDMKWAALAPIWVLWTPHHAKSGEEADSCIKMAGNMVMKLVALAPIRVLWTPRGIWRGGRLLPQNGGRHGPTKAKRRLPCPIPPVPELTELMLGKG